MIQQQAHGLDEETLAKREVIRVDIANDPVRQSVSCFQPWFLLAVVPAFTEFCFLIVRIS